MTYFLSLSASSYLFPRYLEFRERNNRIAREDDEQYINCISLSNYNVTCITLDVNGLNSLTQRHRDK